MILHTVNKSPHANHCFADCLSRVAPGDAVILIEDGVYGANFATSPSLISINESIINLIESQVEFYALQADIEARGLHHILQYSHCKSVDDNGFVDLVIQADKVLSWY